VSQERLQRILSRAGIASRRKAEEMIREGRVTINGRVAEVGEKGDPQRDAIKVDGRRLRPQQGRSHYLLYKPRGYMCTRTDPQGRPTVFDLLPPRFRKSLVIAGRLDFNSEGLMILTTDGELAHRLTHPSFGCSKTYHVKVKGVPAEESIARLRAGVMLEGKRTAPARIRLLKGPRGGKGESNSWWVVELQEGRNRQIREMFFRLGNPVQRLIRVGIGRVADRDLPVGSYRKLSARELESLKSGEAPKPPQRASRRRPSRSTKR
jgi:23S rRNA pseudouridine2605 synthase